MNDMQNTPSFIDDAMTLDEIEKFVILSTLRKYNYNRTHTAKILGIGIRTLQRKIGQYRKVGYMVPAFGMPDQF